MRGIYGTQKPAVTAPHFRLLTREEFEKLSVGEMLAYQRALASHVRKHIDDTHQWIAGRNKISKKSG